MGGILRESHLRFRIGPAERSVWMENMVEALHEVQIEQPLRSALREFFEQSSAYVVNRGGSPPAAADSDEPADDAIRPEIAHRWKAQCGLDDAVASVRAGDAERAIAAVEMLRDRLQRNPSVFVGLLALMMGSGNPAMLHYFEESVTHDPRLVRERYAGRTLLHEASAQGNLIMVELLLRLHADPNAQDSGRPLSALLPGK